MADTDEDLWADSSLYDKSDPSLSCMRIHPDAYHQYHQTHTSASSQSERGEDLVRRRRALAHMVLCLLCHIPYEDKFFFTNVPRILEDSAEDDSNFDIEKAAQAILQLERYILLIAESPWKCEYKKLKLYNGFFKLKVEAHLSKAVDVLTILGFEKTSDSLQLSRPVNVDLCYKVAFDMFVASVECKFLATAFQNLIPKGFSSVDIIKGRRYAQGNLDELESWVEQNCKPKLRLQPRDLSDFPRDHRSEEFVVELPERHQKLAKRVINRDLHRVNSGPGAISVRPRRTDSGYHTEVSSVKSKVGRKAPFSLTPANYDTPSANAAPIFQEGTVDDHLAAASLLTLSPKPFKKELKPTLSLGEYEPRAGAEWNYVRDGLLQRYGKSYFHGERGDILQAATERPYVSNVQDIYDEGVEFDPEDGRQDVAPTLPPRTYSKTGAIPKTTHSTLNRTDYVSKLGFRQVAYPPPLVARGLKPQSGLYRNQVEECDGLVSEDSPHSPRLEDDTLQSQEPSRRRSSSERLFADGDDTAASKSAFFKDKLQDYERLDQQLSFPREHPDMDKNKPMQTNPSWECPSCTFRNKGINPICVMCGKTSQKSPPDLRYTTYSRICSQCTFENEPNAKVCILCEKSLDSYETVV